uniref:50S ribosomal protein L9, chloroplastic n=1 Tax=Kapraunia schneideri TaxID=717899 RepID=A0A1Z1MTA0_9FLOR|nr:ribosomal protein L9 [Kapraunia schneideri]ARW68995.1 ribosomal protein L9 [Kapraunia schneideri]
MKKKIQLISKNQNNNLISVSRGYAFNYLIPTQKAEIPTKKQIKHMEMFQAIQKEKEKTQTKKLKETQEKLQSIGKISLYKKTGENKIIFGSVTDKDINQWITKNTNINTNKIKIKINNIKKIGKDELIVQLKQETLEKLQVNIIPINI